MSLSNRVMYHTQERRNIRLKAPVVCEREDAWLGDGYYFWDDVVDAEQWGHNSKRETGYFEVYKAEILIDNFLDTVFNEAHYRFWISQVEKAAEQIRRKTGLKPTIKEVNEYFKERAIWSEVDGIIFQDIPEKDNILKVKAFYYRKRIQAAVYNLEIITTFAFHSESRCKTKKWY
ncbi:MAG: hypothetical protein U0T72_05160 [Chitinophagales bacterium]